eukprot:Skav229062  [mRNA]  locus=scaffold2611:231357:237114:+ [translate_table: standard]
MRARLPVVRHLCHRNASLAASMKDSSSALHLAAAGGFPQVVEVLLQAKAETDLKRSDGTSPAHLAAEGGHVNILELLLYSRANLESQNSHGHTPRELAQLAYHHQCAAFLQRNSTRGKRHVYSSRELLQILPVVLCPLVTWRQFQQATCPYTCGEWL